MTLKSSPHLLLIGTLIVLLPAGLVAQSGRPDDRPATPGTAPTPPAKTKSVKRARPIRKDPPTTLTIKVTPSDSIVQVDNVVSPLDSNGALTLTSLKVTVPHLLVIRRAGFKDRAVTVELKRGVDNAVSIVLEPVPGLLNVSTFDIETLVVVKQADSLREISRQTGAVAEMQLVPGKYLVQTSRPGFKTAERLVSIRAGQSIYLEPKLEQLEIPEITPPKLIMPAAPMSSSIRVVDKYYVITLQGASGGGDALSGTVDIISSNTVTDVTGSLSGMPCTVEIVRLQNSAEVSMIEVPSPANRWSRAVLRVKPKDPKLLIHVALNWRAAVQGAETEETEAQETEAQKTKTQKPKAQETLLLPDTVMEAEAIHKIVPVYPPAARASRTEGNVVVEVTIDSRGQVVTAKAIRGPVLLRSAAEEAARKWKFRPGTRNGTPVQTSQIINFNFQRLN